MSTRRLTTIFFPWQAATPGLRDWLLHGVVWGGLLLLCWLLNAWAGMERWLHSPWPGLHRAWLPVMGLGVYAMSCLGGRLWQALRSESATVAFEVEAAWREAVR